MEYFTDPSLKLKYQKSKLKVKLWESEFRKEKGTVPSKADIKDAPEKIRDAYKWYWKLKIQAIGGSSFLDFAFDDTISECDPNESQSSRKILGDIQNDPSEGLSDPDKGNSQSESVCSLPCDKTTPEEGSIKIVPETPSEVPAKEIPAVLPDPVKDGNSSADVIKDDMNTKNAWGTHLNKPKEAVKKTPIFRSSSFHYAEKLFVGSKFKKRNPRKSLSFSQNKSDKSKTSPSDADGTPCGTPDVGVETPRNPFSFGAKVSHPNDSRLDQSQTPGHNSTPHMIKMLTTSNSAQLSSPSVQPPAPSDHAVDKELALDSSVKIVKNSKVLSSQPINLVQKFLGSEESGSKLKTERKVDRGWLNRCSAVSSRLFGTPTGALSDSGIDVNEPNISSTPKTIASPDTRSLRAKSMSQPAPSTSAALDDSDNDFIYDSEEELKPSLLSRKSLSAMSFPMQASPVISAPIIEEPKKRKLDAVEAAMAVLAARTDRERHIAKKPRKDMSSSDDEAPIEKKPVSKKKKAQMTKEDLLKKKLASGTANENFVRIDLKKKVYVRGKKHMNFQKYKKQQWKNKKKELAGNDRIYKNDPSDMMAGGGIQTCFKCGDVGHFARACMKMRGDSLLPLEDEEEESPFPTLTEVEEMAKQAAESTHANLKARKAFEAANVAACKLTAQPTYEALPLVVSESTDTAQVDEILDIDPDQFEMDDDDMYAVLKEPTHVKELMRGSVKPIYPLNNDGSLVATPPEVFECLSMFGHKSFRPGQEKAVMRILSGLSTLVTLSTGTGKSLCYQLPAYLYACRSQSITLVVSPLVSLMDDQVADLPPFIRAAALHTNQTPKQREKVQEMVKSGKLQFLLVSPEAVVSGEGRTGFGSILRDLPDIAFACVDEAHCVSQWSHNFRPSYLMICKVLREKLGVRTILGLTATATRATAQSIIEHLNIPDGMNGIIQDIPLPDNLTLTVSKDGNRDAALIQLLNSPEFEELESIIIYCTRREECERLAAMVRACLKKAEPESKKKRVSSNAEAYHAGLSASKRKQVQTAFMTSQLRIVIATVAFGMGINKKNIRSVIHYNMPSSFESYVQEVGRAGRDGLPAHCHLFLDKEGRDLNELRRHIYGDSADRHTIRKLLQRVFVPCKCNKDKINSVEPSDPETKTTNNDESKPDSSAQTADIAGSKEKPEQPKASAGNETPAGETETSTRCPGHEVAFSVQETVTTLDLPEENITTLLCYLELHPKKFLNVLQPAYTVCKVQSYKGMRHVRTVAKKCPPLAMAIALDIERGVKHDKMLTLEFPVVETAAAIGWDSGICKKELKNLEWTKVNNAPRRSGVKVEFSELGFRVRASGLLSSAEQDEALDSLYQRVAGREKTALSQLLGIFKALTDVAFPDIRSVENSDEQETRSDLLKQVVRQYFQDPKFSLGDFKPEVHLENGEQIAADIRHLVASYRDCSFTGRAVARIFHGIASPNFPATVWARCRFWRRYLNSDFKLISQLASRILIQMR